MRILIDMCLSPDFCPLLKSHGHHAEHWSTIGASDAPDSSIMSYARANGYVVFTNDLDFGDLLALTRETGPSVIQTRLPDVRPVIIGQQLISALRQFEMQLSEGALVTLLRSKNKARILPI